MICGLDLQNWRNQKFRFGEEHPDIMSLSLPEVNSAFEMLWPLRKCTKEMATAILLVMPPTPFIIQSPTLNKSSFVRGQSRSRLPLSYQFLLFNLYTCYLLLLFMKGELPLPPEGPHLQSQLHSQMNCYKEMAKIRPFCC